MYTHKEKKTKIFFEEKKKESINSIKIYPNSSGKINVFLQLLTTMNSQSRRERWL